MTMAAPTGDKRRQSSDERRERILEGAFKVFLAYGYDRTTMDDIARAAEISRPALYLVFRNKTDIYRALASQFLNELLARTEAVLAEEGPLAARLDRMCEGVFYCMMREIEETPHGPELLDVKNHLAGDVMTEWRGRLDAVLAQVIEAEALKNGVDLEAKGFSAQTLATMLNDAMEGMKARIADPREHMERGKLYLKVIGAVLNP